VRLFFTDLGEQLLIEVEDNGPGVPAEHAESIFVDGFSTKTGKHRGIGLALVARLCRQHGGAVTLEESELGGGVLHRRAGSRAMRRLRQLFPDFMTSTRR
jgi:two-component system CitB family sensor kinase/CitB family two-component system sensor histidine kinase CitS